MLSRKVGSFLVPKRWRRMRSILRGLDNGGRSDKAEKGRGSQLTFLTPIPPLNSQGKSYNPYDPAHAH